MRVKLGGILVVILLDSGFFERAVEPSHLPVCPWMGNLHAAVLDAMGRANRVEEVGYQATTMGQLGELHIIACECFRDNIRCCLYHMLPKSGSLLGCRDGLQFGEGQLAGAVNGHKQGEFPVS